MRPVDSGATRALPRGLLVAAVLLLGARVAAAVYEKYHPSETWSLVAWVPMEQAQALSRERHLPILYYFSADWCSPCLVMERDVFNNDYAARGINQRYIPVRLKDRRQEEGENPPAVQSLINEHDVYAFPFFSIVGPDGKVQRQTRGYNGYTGTLQFLRIPTPSGRRPAPVR
ncbi:thioredoxin family protein [Archangium lansingense]|uniref:Thioredoxin family protein n=1 Tax=Archangium lansingense TaxID=2995310 RepID=A0ABT4A2W5_9BACT|nr:thioredoxin family protein [Archangium lansinium]MCY1075938.1 thioredoxin family protein [Archangium lansinium]